jgi:UDP:flavonoid glycosyltransferase YjiC (YdhE family)
VSAPPGPVVPVRARFLLATLGSLGDLHPFLATARALVARGHAVTLASHPAYRARAEREGLAFVALPPDMHPGEATDRLVAQAMEGPRASEFVVRGLILPYLDAQFRALESPVAEADVLLAHPLTMALPLLAELAAKPWASVALQPIFMASALDLSAYPGALALHGLLRRSPALARAFLALGRRLTRPWMTPVDALRRSAGLPPTRAHPMFEGGISPWLHLALFSRVLAAPAPDWPTSTRQVGCAFYDRGEGEARLSEATVAFLARHPSPLVFTLGSSAVRTARDFFAASAAAAARLGRPAVLVTDDATVASGALRGLARADLRVAGYEPYGLLFPHAAAIVHQGGAGTTGQVLRAGRPMLVVPFAHDQPDHARRMARAGLGRFVPRERYDAARAWRELALLLADPACAARAKAAADVVAGEPGALGAALALEDLVQNAKRGA